MRHPEQPFEPAVEYVTGFAFGCDGNGVLLIRKQKPAWQAGKLNGVGGKVEEFDWCLAEAMRREFQEETGIETTIEQWSYFGSHQKPARHHLDDQAYALHLFSTVLTAEQMTQLSQPTNEEPEWLLLNDLPRLLDAEVPGTLMYIAIALNHRNRPFHTMTIEDNQ
jgi:8-oxo-dGTP pyrophosphatase MutT (NUDIX family)